MRPLILSTLLLPISFTLAHPSSGLHARQQPRHSRSLCGTLPAPAEFLNVSSAFALEDSLELSASSISSFDTAAAKTIPKWFPKKGLTIKTWFHVVAGSKKPEEGWINDTQIRNQFDVINADFAPHNIRFSLQGVTRTINVNWTYDGNEYEMKKALRKGDYKTLNVYFQTFLDGGAPGSLGYAKFPGSIGTKRGERNFTIDGVNVQIETVPGGAYEDYNLGRTATHEIGHWLGLFHTFNDYACTGPGDFVADTPVQKDPTDGCPIGIDTCPDEPGLDPIHNYMDYSYDWCYEEFTPLQRKRMYSSWYTYRDPKPKSAWWD